MSELDELLGEQEPHATFHDADLLSVDVDYRTRELTARWNLCVGDPDAAQPARERQREGRLQLRGLLFWIVDPPGPSGAREGTPWLTADGALSEAPTPAGRDLAQLLPPGAVGWYLFFSDWNAYAYCAAGSARFEWA